jgi:hypothetical protein
LHDDWREVLQTEFEEAHKYTQRILEDLYDERSTVAKGSFLRGDPREEIWDDPELAKMRSLPEFVKLVGPSTAK